MPGSTLFRSTAFSDSKGVAIRVPYQDMRSPKANPICDEECSKGMLVKLQDYIDSHPTGDIFIVLHQMGNHGPACTTLPAELRKIPPRLQE